MTDLESFTRIGPTSRYCPLCGTALRRGLLMWTRRHAFALSVILTSAIVSASAVATHLDRQNTIADLKRKLSSSDVAALSMRKTISNLSSQVGTRLDGQNNIADLNDKLSRSDVATEDFRDTITKLSGQVAMAEAEVAQLGASASQDASGLRIQQLTAQFKDMTGERDAAEDNGKTAANAQVGFQAKLNDLISSNMVLKREATDFRSQVASLNAKLAALSSERDGIKNQFNAADHECHELRSLNSELKASLFAANQEIERIRHPLPPQTGNMTWTRWSQFLGQYQSQRGSMTLAEVQGALGNPDKKPADDIWIYLDPIGRNYQVTFTSTVRGVTPIMHQE